MNKIIKYNLQFENEALRNGGEKHHRKLLESFVFWIQGYNLEMTLDVGGPRRKKKKMKR